MALQYVISQNSGLVSRHYKQVACDGPPNGVILAVQVSPEEFSQPAYSDIEVGSKVIFSPTLLSVPVFGQNN
jgi:hypothetical protein